MNKKKQASKHVPRPDFINDRISEGYKSIHSAIAELNDHYSIADCIAALSLAAYNTLLRNIGADPERTNSEGEPYQVSEGALTDLELSLQAITFLARIGEDWNTIERLTQIKQAKEGRSHD